MSTLAIKKQKMRGEILQGVYRVWLVRKLLPVICLEIILTSIFLLLIARMVFVRQIIINAMDVVFVNPIGIFTFLERAFMETTFSGKLLSIGMIVLVAFLIRHITQGALRYILVKENFFSRTES